MVIVGLLTACSDVQYGLPQSALLKSKDTFLLIGRLLQNLLKQYRLKLWRKYCNSKSLNTPKFNPINIFITGFPILNCNQLAWNVLRVIFAQPIDVISVINVHCKTLLCKYEQEIVGEPRQIELSINPLAETSRSVST